MNSKKRDFLISISVIYAFSLLIILFVNYMLISMYGFNHDNFMFIIIPLLILGLGLFLSFSTSILKPLFKSDEELQKNIKETLHELNIPVSTIKMNTQMLEKNIKDEKSLKRLNRIKQASNNLLKLYENMEYDIKKQIDKIDKQKVDLSLIVNQSIEKFQDIKRDINISVDIPSVELNTDMNGFERTIDNLISNAIKYNIKENALVEVTYKDKVLSIFNTGENIDTKNLLIIFDKYFQEDKSTDGFGLGLSMVKEFCDKNKITIKIDTLPNGNRFSLNLENILLK